MTRLRQLAFAFAFVVPSAVACSTPSPDESNASSESGLVSDVASMSQNADGTFEVTCKDGRLEHAVTADAIRTDQVCKPRRPAVRCGVLYYFNDAANGTIAQVMVGSLDESFDGYPNISRALGDENLPYRASVTAVQMGAATDGYFDLYLTEKSTGHVTLTESPVSLATLAESTAYVRAGFLRMKVQAFVYEGTTYDSIDAWCNIMPPPAN